MQDKFLFFTRILLFAATTIFCLVGSIRFYLSIFGTLRDIHVVRRESFRQFLFNSAFKFYTLAVLSGALLWVIW